jgi:predicted dehydrogenase
MSSSLLVLGYSNIASRRVIPAMLAVAPNRPVDIASKSQRFSPDGECLGVIFDDYERALERSTAEAVYVSLPNALHFGLAKKALKSGRHVIIDKPACVTMKETQTLLNCAAKRERLLAEATVFSYHSQFVEMVDFLEKNGPLKCVSAQFVIPPLQVKNFRVHKELGGGCLLDMGPYAAAIARLFLPQDGLEVHVIAEGVDPRTGVDTGFALLAGTTGGARLTGHFSFCGEYQNRLIVVGARGSLMTERLFSLPADVDPVWSTRIGNVANERTLAKDDAFASFLKKVFRAIGTGEHALFASDLLRDAIFRQRLEDRMKGER